MTRMFKRWISLLVCMFLPTMMFSFLYHRNEILQKKIANSIQLDQRLFPKSLPADETSGSILQRLVFPTPYYRVERDLDEQMGLPMSMSGMASREVIRSTLTTKKMITTRTAIEVHSLRETKETLGTAERNVIIATGNDVSGAEKPSKDIKKRPSKRSRRTNKRSPVHPQELPQQVREVNPITSVGVAGKFNDKQMIPTPAPVARFPSFQNNIEEFAEVSEKLDGLTIVSHVESVDPVSRTAIAAPVKMIRQKVEEVKPIKSVGVAGKVDDKQIIPTSAPVTRVPSFQNNIEEFAKVSEKLDGLAIASHVESVDPVSRTATAAPVKMIRQHVGEVKPIKSVGVAGKFDDKQKIPTSAPVARVPPFQNNIEEVAKVSKKIDGLAIASHVESVDPVSRTATAAPAKIILRLTAETKNITELTEITNDNLDMKSVNETRLGGSIQASNLEKPSEQKSPSALSAPTKRKSKKTNDRIDVQVMNIEQKFDETILDIKGKVMNMTDIKDEVVRTMEEQQENNVPVKLPSRKEDTKRKRDRKSRTRHKSHPKEEEVNVPVTLSLNFNLNDSKSHLPVILVSTNKAFLNFTDNWLESVKRSGIRSGVTLVAEDREAFNYLNNRTDIELNVVLNDVSESPGERLLFDSPAYKQLVNKRPSYILQLLSSGHDVLFSDVDIVWLKNPLPYFTNDTNDIWLQEDLHEPTVYCAGFTFYRSSPATIALVTEWVQTLALHPTYPDQRVLNGLLKKKRWQGDNIKRAVMDSRLFPSGRLYFDPDWREANKDTEQVMVHNNWIKGHDRKVERFRNEGLWYLDVKETGQS